MFTKTDAAKIPKGEYILEVKAEWDAKTEANPVLKQMNLMVASPAKVTVESLSDDDAIKALSLGKASKNGKGACDAYGSRHLGTGKSMA